MSEEMDIFGSILRKGSDPSKPSRQRFPWEEDQPAPVSGSDTSTPEPSDASALSQQAVSEAPKPVELEQVQVVEPKVLTPAGSGRDLPPPPSVSAVHIPPQGYYQASASPVGGPQRPGGVSGASGTAGAGHETPSSGGPVHTSTVPAAPAPAIAGLRAASADERRAALRALSEAPLDAASVEAVAEILSDPDVGLKLNALTILERSPGSVPLHALGSAAMDPDPAVRARILALAGRRMLPDALGLICDRIGEEDDHAVVGAGLMGVFRIVETAGVNGSTPAICRALGAVAPSVHARFRREIGLLAERLDPEVVRSLLDAEDERTQRGATILALESGDETLSSAARASVLDRGQQGVATPVKGGDALPLDAPPDLMGALLAALIDDDPDVRLQARTALEDVPRELRDQHIVSRIETGSAEEVARLAPMIAALEDQGLTSSLARRMVAIEPSAERVQIIAALRHLRLTHELAAGWRTSPDRAHRILAVQITSLLDPFGTSGVGAALADPNAAVRLAAIEVLGDRVSPEITDLLMRVIATDSTAEVRRAATLAFAGASREMRARVAEAALKDGSPAVRTAALDLLRDGTEEQVTILVRALRDGDRDVAIHAAKVMGRVSGPEALALIWSVIRTCEPDVRDQMVEGVVAGDADALRRLAWQGVESADPAERAASLAVLLGAGGEVPGPFLLECLSDTSRDVRIEALRALASRPEDASIPVVGPRVRDPDVMVRQLAVTVLAEAQDDLALPYLVEAARDPHPDVQDRARACIMELRSLAVADLLVASLAQPGLARAAEELLGQMGQVGVESMLDAAESAPADVRRAIGDVLRASGATEQLLPDLQHRSPMRRKRALIGIGAIEDPSLLDPLIDGLSDPDPSVRITAARLIGMSGDQRAVEPLRSAFVADPDMDVVRAIESALRALTSPAMGSFTDGVER